MENGAAESGTGLLRAFGNGGDLFNSAILLMSSPGKWSSGWVCYPDIHLRFPLMGQHTFRCMATWVVPMRSSDLRWCLGVQNDGERRP